MKPSSNTDGISSGSFAQDFELLLKRFKECDSLEFTAFTVIWRSMKMSMLSAGKVTERETRQFVDDCLLAVVKYFHSQQNFETKIGAFYLLYSLYMTQPVKPKSKIRVTLKTWKTLNSFIEESISKQLIDAEYIFHKLCAMKAFLYVAPPNEMLQGQYVTDQSEEDEAYMDHIHYPNASAMENIFTNDNIEQLSAVHDQYQELKHILSETELSAPVSSINMLDVNTATVIADLVQRFKNETEKEPNKRKIKLPNEPSTDCKKINISQTTEKIAETNTGVISTQTEFLSEDEEDSQNNFNDEDHLIISENDEDSA